MAGFKKEDIPHPHYPLIHCEHCGKKLISNEDGILDHIFRVDSIEVKQHPFKIDDHGFHWFCNECYSSFIVLAINDWIKFPRKG